MCIRTNNAAESVHAQLNPKASGRLSLFRFLKTIEEQMNRSRKRIRAGCQSESSPVTREKNRLLALELHKLLNSKTGVLEFLDNCSSVLARRTLREVNHFVPVQIPTVDDILWRAGKRGHVRAAARGRYWKLCPNGQFAESEILKNVTRWSFRVLDAAVFNDDNEALYLVENGPRRSFVELCQLEERLFRESGREEADSEENDIDLSPDCDQENDSRFQASPTPLMPTRTRVVDGRARNEQSVHHRQMPNLRNRHDFDFD